MSRLSETGKHDGLRTNDSAAARAVVIVLCLLLLAAVAIGIGSGTLGEHTLRPAPTTSAITIP